MNNSLVAGADMVAFGADKVLFVASETSGFITWSKIAIVPNVPVFGLLWDIPSC